MPIGIRVTELPAAVGTLDDDDEFLTLEDGSLRRASRAQAGPKASIVQVADTANQFTGTNVETVLAEIQDNVDALVISGGGISVASEAEALAGTDNTKAMTPARVKGVGPAVNVRSYGALGDGATNDTAAFTAALADGRPVFVPEGVYMVDPIECPEGTYISGRGLGSVLKRRASALRVLSITGSDVTIRDLKIDGNSAAAGTSNTGCIQSSAAAYTGITIDHVTIVDAFAVGIHLLYVSEAAVTNCRIYDSVETGILWSAQGGGADITDITITGNLIDRSGRTSDANTNHGMLLRGSDDITTRKQRRVVVANNIVRQHATGGICIEAWSVELAVTGNVTSGGSMGISTTGVDLSITGNTVVGAVDLGIEVAAGVQGPTHNGRAIVSGNLVDGQDVTGSGIVSTAVLGPDEVNISANTIVGFVNEGIYLQGQPRSLVTGNYVRWTSSLAAGATVGIRYLAIGRGQSYAHTTISGNHIDGTDDDVNSFGININQSDATDPDVTFAITGNFVARTNYGVGLTSTGGDFAGTIVGNNVEPSVTNPYLTSLSGGAVATGVLRRSNLGIADS